jgi:DNA-binding LacI/PurR family transcriptional regulator
MIRKQTKLIGFVSPSQVEKISAQYITNLYKKAALANCDLVTVIGNHLNSPQIWDNQENFIYDLITPSVFDGLIFWGSTICTYVSPLEEKKFFKKFTSFPIINIGSVLEGIPSIIMNDIEGISKIMDHLIAYHGFTRIAFIRGPENHFSAEKRFQGYLESLKNHGLPINKDLISPPYDRFTHPKGTEAIQFFLFQKRYRSYCLQ